MEETTIEIQNAANQIWAYCREHRGSLDSERHCRHITEVLAEMQQPYQERIDEAKKAKLAAESTSVQARKTTKRIRADYTDALRQLASVNQEVKRLKSEMRTGKKRWTPKKS